MADWLEEWAAPVYRFSLRLTGDLHTAEDLAQEALLRAWNGRRRLRDPRATRVWLFRIAANLWRDWLRRRKTRPAPLPEDYPGPTPAPDQFLSEQEELGRALSALDGLPSRQREVLYLNACEGLPPSEIADVLSISPEAAKASLCVARQKLRRQLDVTSEPLPPSEHAT